MDETQRYVQALAPQGTVSYMMDKLLGRGGQERYQMWPERMVRGLFDAPDAVARAGTYPAGSREAIDELVPAGNAIAGLAGGAGAFAAPRGSLGMVGGKPTWTPQVIEGGLSKLNVKPLDYEGAAFLQRADPEMLRMIQKKTLNDPGVPQVKDMIAEVPGWAGMNHREVQDLIRETMMDAHNNPASPYASSRLDPNWKMPGPNTPEFEALFNRELQNNYDISNALSDAMNERLRTSNPQLHRALFGDEGW